MSLTRLVRRARSGQDDGLVAVIVALSISSFLLVIGAFAVDFGNAFARRQTLQTSADLAALAAAAMLPNQDAARRKVHDLFCSSNNENHVLGWPTSTCAPDDRWMDDRIPSNGEVTFYNADGDGDGRYERSQEATAGITATAVRVLTPQARVEFGLGAVTGATGVDLQRAATAKMGSVTGPGGVQPIPVTPPETPPERGSICVTDTAGSTTTTGVTLPVGQDPCSGITVLRRGFVQETRRTGNANALVLNLQRGLDHVVRPAVGQNQCNAQAGTSFTTGGVVNCLKINPGPLVDSTHAAYLDPGGLLLRTGCPGIGGTTEVGGHFGVDNHTLFQPAFIPGDQAFRDGVEAAIRTGQPPAGNQVGALSAKVFLCPRLFVVPVLNAPIVNGGLSGGTYPVQGLVYLYIDDTEPPDHGVTFDTGGTVTQLHAIVIDPAWFPKTADVPLPVGEYLGENLTKQVALVHDFDDPGT